MASKRRTRHKDDSFDHVVVFDIAVQAALPIILILVWLIVTASNTGEKTQLQAILSERSLVAVVAITATVIIVALALVFKRKLKISTRASKNGSANLELK